MENLLRIAAFAVADKGGNPAGVVIGDSFPSEDEMLKAAAEVGYSETCFLVPFRDGWRIRYFSPVAEVPFCGHATIAAGAALGRERGAGYYRLYLNDRELSIELSETAQEGFSVTLQSPETWTSEVPDGYLEEVLLNFNFTEKELNSGFPPRIAFGGSKHLILVVKDRGVLTGVAYEFDPVRELMIQEGLATISVIYVESERKVCARNFFAPGGIYEDAATGAAAAALAGYFRDTEWGGSTGFEISQGVEMGRSSRISVHYTERKGESVRISGKTRFIDDEAGLT